MFRKYKTAFDGSKEMLGKGANQLLRYSRYNHQVKIPQEDAYVLYNFRTGALLRLDPVKKAVFDNAADLPEDSRAIKSLQQGGFLVA